MKDNMKVKNCPEVYPVSEDTLLLSSVSKNYGGNIFCEIGCGTGYISLSFSPRFEYVIAIDIDPKAVKCTLENFKNNGKEERLDVICGDALKSIREGEIFDLIVSNPPYLPYVNEEVAWSGGDSGYEKAIYFSYHAYLRLKTNRSFLVILSSLSNIEKFVKEARKFFHIVRKLSKTRVGLFEELFLIECIK